MSPAGPVVGGTLEFAWLLTQPTTPFSLPAQHIPHFCSPAPAALSIPQHPHSAQEAGTEIRIERPPHSLPEPQGREVGQNYTLRLALQLSRSTEVGVAPLPTVQPHPRGPTSLSSTPTLTFVQTGPSMHEWS